MLNFAGTHPGVIPDSVDINRIGAGRGVYFKGYVLAWLTLMSVAKTLNR